MKKINLLFKRGFIGWIFYYVVTVFYHIPTTTAKIDIAINDQGRRKDQKKGMWNSFYNNNLESGCRGQNININTIIITTLTKLADSTIFEKKGARDFSESSVK